MLRELRVGNLGSLSFDIYLLVICLPGVVLKFWGYKVPKNNDYRTLATQQRKSHELYEFGQKVTCTE